MRFFKKLKRIVTAVALLALSIPVQVNGVNLIAPTMIEPFVATDSFKFTSIDSRVDSVSD